MGRGDVVLTRDNREFVRQDCLRDALIYEIVDLEWSMMQEMHSAQGKKLDELHKAVEVGKRPYQNVLKVIISAVVTAAVCFLIGFMMHIFLN